MSEPSAKVIADSISPAGQRLTTMEVVMHRFVLAEFNTHRVFSRNSASSRAIPVRKQIDRVLNDPAVPLEWRAEQKGMQGGDLLSESAQHKAKADWLEASGMAVEMAESLITHGVHKSLVNRLLEPFMWHTVIVSSTEWSNFFVQRCSPLAQPEIRSVAECMRAVLRMSQPIPLQLGEWHLPYVDEGDRRARDYASFSEDDWCKISAARCARVSYLTHDGKRDPNEDLAMYGRLVTAEPPHASPLEHVATPAALGVPVDGNFDGWRQLRHIAISQPITGVTIND